MKKLFSLMLVMFSLIGFSQDTVYFSLDVNGDTITHPNIPSGFIAVNVNTITDEVDTVANVKLHTTNSVYFTETTPNTYSNYLVTIKAVVDSTPKITSFFTVDTNNSRFYHDTVTLNNSMGDIILNTTFTLSCSSFIKIGLNPQIPNPMDDNTVDLYVKIYHTTTYVQLTSTMSTNDVNVPELSVYPNPTTGLLNVEGASLYELYTPSGSLISSGQVTDNKININAFDSGYYILKLVTPEKSVFIKKILVI